MATWCINSEKIIGKNDFLYHFNFNFNFIYSQSIVQWQHEEQLLNTIGYEA